MSSVRLLAGVVLSVCLAGCVSSKWPHMEEDKVHLILVAGEFSGTHELDENPCLFSQDVIEGGVADCWSGTPSISTLNVSNVVYGQIYEPQLRVAYHPSPSAHSAPGHGNPQLALLGTDGKYYVLERMQPIARTTRGDWALPVETDFDLLILPCGARPLVKPLRFAQPRPNTTHGILLEDMQQFMTTAAPKDPQEYHCNEYE